MPLYFFHLRRKGEIIPDLEGSLLGSSDEARRVAVFEAREVIIRILNTEESVPFDDRIEVADEHGVVLFVVTFKDALG